MRGVSLLLFPAVSHNFMQYQKFLQKNPPFTGLGTTGPKKVLSGVTHVMFLIMSLYNKKKKKKSDP